LKYFNNLVLKQTSFKMASKYALRKNNYKVNLKTKIMKEINVCMDKIDEINKNNNTDIAAKIIHVRRMYLLFNKNIDLFDSNMKMLDIVYKIIDLTSITIVEYIEELLRLPPATTEFNHTPSTMLRMSTARSKNPTKSLRTCKSTLLQFDKFKKYYKNYYKNYWANITDALNTKTCEDMTREILQYIH